jgi:hypothetical protein
MKKMGEIDNPRELEADGRSISVKDEKHKIQKYSYKATHKEIKELLVDKVFEGEKSI